MAQDFVPNPRTPPTAVAGQWGTGDYNTDRVKVDMKSEITTYMPSASPYTVLLTKVKKNKRQVWNHEFKWQEDDEYPRELELTTAALAGDVTLTVTAGEEAKVAVGYVLMNVRTREQVYIGTVASGVITVTRDIGGEGEVDMDAGDVLVFTTPAAEEGADIAEAHMNKLTTRSNYCQTIRTSIDWTRRAAKIALYGGYKGPAWERKKMGIEHLKSMSLAFYFGRKNSWAGTTHNVTTMGGLEQAISTNVWDLSGTGSLDERSWDEMLEEGFHWGIGGKSGLKYLMASARLITEINWFAKGDKLRYTPLGKTVGFGAMQYLSPHGRVNIIHDPILDANHPGWGFLIDFNHVQYVYFADDDTHLLKDRGGNGIDGSKEEFLTDCSQEVDLEAAHVLIKGLS